MFRLPAIISIASVLALAGCGETVGQQLLAGAGAGAVGAAVVNGNVATGAAVGAAGNVAYCSYYKTRC